MSILKNIEQLSKPDEWTPQLKYVARSMMILGYVLGLLTGILLSIAVTANATESNDWPQEVWMNIAISLCP